MPPPEVITPVLRRFVEEHLDSVEKLEVLLLLQRTSSRYWSAKEVAGTLGMLETPTARLLDALCARNLLDVRTASDVQFRFAPVSPELGQRASELEAAYRTQRAAVLTLILSGSASERSVREFADAFRIKKETPDG